MTVAYLSPETSTESKFHECGATLTAGKSCQELFEDFLVLEFGDPDYGQVHFLTVACFMIQHGRYSDQALVWMGKQLYKYHEDDISSRQIVRGMGSELSHVQRKWKVTRQADDPPLVKISWSITIADVATQYQDTKSYCALVDQWARRTLAEMQPQLTS